jgi:DNA-binding GntR family transcriptional regulator
MRGYAKIAEKIETELKNNLLYESVFWPVTEEKLAARFGVSRMPVRVVIARLERENLLVRRNKTGTRPRVPNLEEIAQIFEVRLMLEPAVTVAATGQMTASDLRGIRNHAELCDKYNRLGNKKLAARHDVVLHRKIAVVSGNKYVLAMLESLSILTRIFIAFAAESKRDHLRNPDSHLKIWAALREKDAGAAGRAMFAHLDWSRQRLRELADKKERAKV